MKLRRDISRSAGRLARDTGGIAAVEFALTAPLLLILFLGIAMIGLRIQDHGEAREGIRAGAHAVMSDVDDLSVVRSVTQSALKNSADRSKVNVSRMFRCDGAETTSSSCQNSQVTREFIKIEVSIFEDAKLGGAPTVSEQLEVRVQ